MIRTLRTSLALVLSTVVCLAFSVIPAEAQFVGTFSWQSAPYCNIITLNVTQTGSVFTVDGFDNSCGADRPAPVTGAAVLNQNGTVTVGLTTVDAEAEPTHLDVVVNVGTLGGPWSDSAGNNGTFVFNGAGAGNRRPSGSMRVTSFGTVPSFIGRRASVTAGEPSAVGLGSALLFLGARGHDGIGFTTSSNAYINMTSAEAWTASDRGTRIDFATTPNGSTGALTRLGIDQNGRIGIGEDAPAQLLDVDGNIRVGSGAIGCIEDSDGDVITGNCFSDARFKRDVVSFAPMLSKVAALRPVHFYWRTDEFPSRSFGTQQSYGLMAQEVEEVLPELVTTDAEGFKAVNYSKLPLMALQAIRELKAKNDALERRLTALEAHLKSSADPR